MVRMIAALSLLAALGACGDGQPLYDDPDAVEEVEQFEELPPGTEDASVDASILRVQAEDGQGGGTAIDMVYVASNDTFTVDNLAFDGQNVYQRGAAVASIGGSIFAPDASHPYIPLQLYDADVVVVDPLTGGNVTQILYRGIVAISPNLTDEGEPRTEVAVVRSLDFNHGFGGYQYQRRGGTILPTSGQAGFAGDYAGIRTYDKQSVMDLVFGKVELRLDFEDFNANTGVSGEIYDRVVTDLDGNVIADLVPVTPDVELILVEGATSLNTDGELAGELQNSIGSRLYETGNFFAIAAGDMTTLDDNGGEVVGVVELQSLDPRFQEMRVIEVGGFIATRK